MDPMQKATQTKQQIMLVKANVTVFIAVRYTLSNVHCTVYIVQCSPLTSLWFYRFNAVPIITVTYTTLLYDSSTL